MTNTPNASIAAALAAPKTHRVVTLFADGTERTHETRSEASAETYAVGERRKVGRNLLSGTTGEWVRVVAVVIEKI